MANMLNVSQFAGNYAAGLPDPVDNSSERDQTVHSEIPAHGPQRASTPLPGSTSVVEPKLTPEFQNLHNRLTAPIQGLAAKAGGDLVETAAFL